MKLSDAPVGVLKYNNVLLLKTEYRQECSTGCYPICYVLKSGERFWGDASTAQELNELEVEVAKVTYQ